MGWLSLRDNLFCHIYRNNEKKKSQTLIQGYYRLLEYIMGLNHNVNIRVTYSRLPVSFCNQYNYNDISFLNLYKERYKAVVNEPVLRSRSVACWTHPGVRWGRWTWSCNRETRVSKGVTTQLKGTQYHSNYLWYSNMIAVYMFIKASIYLDSATLWI